MPEKTQAGVEAKEKKSKARRKPTIERLKAERVEEMVKAMRGWDLLRKPSSIQRIFSFREPRVAATFGSFILEMGALEAQDLNVTMRDKRLFVTISRRGGLAQIDLDFAQKLG